MNALVNRVVITVERLSLEAEGRTMMSGRDLSALLSGVVREPGEELIWSALADWLEENDDPARAELLRLHRLLLATCLEPDRPERAAWQARLVALMAGGVRPCGPRETVALGGGVLAMEFAYVPPGRFLMGSPSDEPEREEDEVKHRVTLTQGYFLGVHPVTQAQWRAVMGDHHSVFKGDDLPVEKVSWGDCEAFCEKLSGQAGRRFRLPTEAEWEYACRAGTTTPFHFGDTISTDQANHDGDYTYGDGEVGIYRGATTPAGGFPANASGLRDMHGNVGEWCADWYGPLDGDDVVDPRGPQSGEYRVLRGGSWYDYPGRCRAASRHKFAPEFRFGVCGLRVLLCPD